MNKLETLKRKLVEAIHEELTGDLNITLGKSHFDLMEERTGISKRKLKEIFGIYKSRSRGSHEYTMDRLAEFAGYKSWHDYIKSQASSNNDKNLSHNRKTELSKKVSIVANQQKKVQISIIVK